MAGPSAPGPDPVPSRRLAVLAYGSLLHAAGPELSALVVGREPCRTPFPVEYGRVSPRWGGGPVLVPHPDGAPVDGALLVLREGVGLGVAVEALRRREGLPGAAGILEVRVPGAEDLVVLCASLPRNLGAAGMTPDALAGRAVESVAAGGARNGVAYLRGALEAGVRTPASAEYRRRILERVGAADLEEAEARLLRLRPSDDPEGC